MFVRVSHICIWTFWDYKVFQMMLLYPTLMRHNGKIVATDKNVGYSGIVLDMAWDSEAGQAFLYLAYTFLAFKMGVVKYARDTENWELFIQKIHIARHFIVREWSDFSDNEIHSLSTHWTRWKISRNNLLLYIK